MTNSFESLLPGVELGGSLQEMVIFEAGPANHTQNIRTNQGWGVTLNWEATGGAANLVDFINHEQWQVRLLLESIGDGTEYRLPSAGPHLVRYGAADPTVPIEGGTYVSPTQRQWTDIAVIIPAFEIPAGLYKMAVTVQLVDDLGNMRAMAGFIEGVLVNFYDSID